MFPEFVRVAQVDTDWEVSVTRSMYEAMPLGYVLLNERATDDGGNPLPASKKTSAPVVEKKNAARQADKPGHEADTPKES